MLENMYIYKFIERPGGENLKVRMAQIIHLKKWDCGLIIEQEW